MSVEAGPASCKAAAPASQVILLAEPRYFIGTFRVSTTQVQPHPNQRSVSLKWVDSLHQRFMEVGIDRAAHPIKVLLDTRSAQCNINTRPATVTDLPTNMAVLVYHGQHRILACQKMDNIEEHWWYAEAD